jgi:hypothetical protein
MQYKYDAAMYLIRNGHTTTTARFPVCSAKLSIVGPGEYYGGDHVRIPGVVLLVISIPATNYDGRGLRYTVLLDLQSMLPYRIPVD